MNTSELQESQSRRKQARRAFLNMATMDGWITPRSLTWFNERNTDALADVLESMTADEIAKFMMDVVKEMRS